MDSERAVRLVATEPEDKVWAALVVLGGYEAWVTIDAVGDFLLKRQADASRVKFDPKDPNTRYALQPQLMRWQKGWEDSTIAMALANAVDHDFIEHSRVEGLNIFRAKKLDKSNLWKLRTTSTPTHKSWANPRVLHVEQTQT